ncbi:MAG: FAD-binding oxidoreductase [Rubrivivax sp.]|nr:FAD-binding oxidoreductase [Rubrivivax sp.]
MSAAAALEAWCRLLGEDAVLGPDAALAAYGGDTGGARRHLAAALRVRHRDQVAELMRIAHRHRLAVHPLSTGRNWGYGSALPRESGSVILDLSALRQILHFDAELGVVTVEPGVTQGMLAEFLQAGGHPFMVPTTGAGPTCSLVGNALERGYGITPYADHFAAVTDLEAVLHDGRVYRSALGELGLDELARLFKWGIGPYTAGLFSQSRLGVVTRMSILLARRPQAVQVGLFGLREDALLEPAVTRLREVLASLPGIVGGCNLMNRLRVLAMTAPYPAARIGADGLIPPDVLAQLGRQYRIHAWTGFMTLYGTPAVLKAARRQIRASLGGLAGGLVFIGRDRAQWLGRVAARLPGQAARRLAATLGTLRRSLDLVEGRPNETALALAYWRSGRYPTDRPADPAADGCGLLWYAPLVPMRPATARAFVDMAQATARRHGIEPLLTLTSLSERLFDATLPILFDRHDPAALAAAQACLAELIERGHALGVYPYRQGIEQARPDPGITLGFPETMA